MPDPRPSVTTPPIRPRLREMQTSFIGFPDTLLQYLHGGCFFLTTRYPWFVCLGSPRVGYLVVYYPDSLQIITKNRSHAGISNPALSKACGRYFAIVTFLSCRRRLLWFCSCHCAEHRHILSALSGSSDRYFSRLVSTVAHKTRVNQQR